MGTQETTVSRIEDGDSKGPQAAAWQAEEGTTKVWEEEGQERVREQVAGKKRAAATLYLRHGTAVLSVRGKD